MAIGGGNGLRAELKAKPILWAVLACFVFETGMNAIFGYRQAGAGFSLAALLYGAIFIGLAFLGAWTCVELFKVRGKDGFAWARRAAFAIPFLGCLAVSQFSGWGVLGVTLADGGAKRDVAATKSSLAGETLAQMRAERAELALPKRPKGTLQAELNLELRKTSKTYPDGDGPNAMRLKGEIAAWDAAETLDKEIATAMQALETAPAVAGGNPEFAVVTDWTGAQTSDVRKWWSVFLVALIGSFANFGFALAGVGQDTSPAPKKADEFFERFDFGPKQLGNGGAQQLYDEMAARFGPDAVDRVMINPKVAALKAAAVEMGYARTPPAPQEMAPVPAPPLSGSPPSFPPSVDPRGGATLHGAPIAIHNHFSGAPGAALAQAPQPSLPPREAQPQAGPAAGLSTSEAPALPPLLTGPPVDKSGLQAKIDHLQLFKQFCLVPSAGALVAGDDMYARYAAWAGQRCLNEQLFHTLFGGICDVPVTPIGGAFYYVDVAVRTTQTKQIAS